MTSVFAFAGEEISSWTSVESCSPQNPSLILRLDTEIRAPLAKDFEALVKSCPGIKTIELRLNSGGGSITEISEMAKILEPLKKQGVTLTTRVHNGDECDSSCVPLFALGDKRQAGEVSAFMFHGVSITAISNIPHPASTQEMLDLIRKASGLNGAWLQSLINAKIFAVPSMYWLSGKELVDQKSGLVTELLPRQTLLKPYDRSYKPR